MAYRKEIDGLRAVAVSAVILFHLGHQYLPGGFSGVDIFFVISGYLICGIIFRETHAGTFSWLDFYRRRCLRILPPLAVVTCTSLMVAYHYFLPTEFASMAYSAIAALLFVSNIWFFHNIDYFNPQAESEPMLHTWSLGVEEQFYLFIPLLIVFFARRAQRWLWLSLAATVLLSFLISVFAPKDVGFYLIFPAPGRCSPVACWRSPV